MQPTGQVAYTRTATTITCYSARPVTWRKGDMPLINNVAVAQNNTLIFQSLQESDSGVYTCQGSLGSGLIFSADSELLVGGKNLG